MVHPDYNENYYYIAYYFAIVLTVLEAVVFLPASFIQHNFWVAIFLAILIAFCVGYIMYISWGYLFMRINTATFLR